MSDTNYETLAGRYELHRQLATGGSADVFLARDQLLNRPVAVKILNAELSADEAFVERLRREAQLVASLNHQNIVGVFDQGTHDGAPFIVMEYVDGRSLAEVLKAEGRLHPDRAATIAVDVAAALDAAHKQGMVHMDVKPGNVLVTPDGQVKLADFGIAKALTGDTETDITVEDGKVLGTATYLSPEQAQGQKVGPRSDVYSLAVVLYEKMTGRPPFIGDNASEIALKHVEEAPQPPRRLGVDIAASLEAITLKGLSKSPVNRYPSVREFAADLKRYLGGAHSLSGGPSLRGPAPASTTLPHTPQPVSPEQQAAAAAGAVANPSGDGGVDASLTSNPRPTTGRSTPPLNPDHTVVLGTPAEMAQNSAPHSIAPQGVGHVARPQTVPQRQVGPPPAGQSRSYDDHIRARDEDTRKRNMMTFGGLILVVALLAISVLAIIRGISSPDETSVEETVSGAESVTVSNFNNMTQDQALSRIEALDLVPAVEFESNSEVERGRVFKQEPTPGKIVEIGSTVTITVSQPDDQIEVPAVVALAQEDAVRQLSQFGFQFQINEVDSDLFGPGEVISQSPLPRELAQRGSVVQLEVSLGPSERTVPDLEGLDAAAALSELADLDFRFVQVDEPDPEVEEGTVLRSEPAAGSLLRGGELVTVYVSSGIAQLLVPSVVDLLADTARQTLITAGFEVVVDFQPVTDESKFNVVLSQSPDATIELEEGSTVRIVVGQEAPPEETTTTTTTTTTAAPETTTTTEAVAEDG